MADKEPSLEEKIAEEHIAPVILDLLKPWSAADMAEAISKKINLGKELKEDADYLNELKLLLLAVPFTEKLEKSLKKKKWIDWFVKNQMKQKRPDLYNQIVFSENGSKYIRKQIRKIVTLVFA